MDHTLPFSVSDAHRQHTIQLNTVQLKEKIDMMYAQSVEKTSFENVLLCSSTSYSSIVFKVATKQNLFSSR